jgi:hypothetical protein
MASTVVTPAKDRTRVISINALMESIISVQPAAVAARKTVPERMTAVKQHPSINHRLSLVSHRHQNPVPAATASTVATPEKDRTQAISTGVLTETMLSVQLAAMAARRTVLVKMTPARQQALAQAQGLILNPKNVRAATAFIVVMGV